MNLNTIETAEVLENISFVTDPTIVCKYAAIMLRQQQAEIGCYKLELELHKAMIQDLEKVIKIKERDYNFMKDLAIGTEELLRKAQEK